MATTIPNFVKVSQVITALGIEVEQDTSDVQDLVSILQARWYQEPVSEGQLPKTVDLILPELKTESVILNSLARYKTQKTDESNYNGYRAYKRFYINSDDVLDARGVSSFSTSPWGCKWRLAGLEALKVTDTFYGTFVNDTDRYNSVTSLELTDYDDSSANQVNPKYISETYIYTSSLYGVDWSNTGNQHQSELYFNKTARFLVTARIELKLLTKSKSIYNFSDLSSVTKIYQQNSPTAHPNIEAITGPQADAFFPYARLKILHFSYNSVTGAITLKNIYFSGKLSMSPAGVTDRTFTLGFSSLINIEENDSFQFYIERSHKTIVVNLSDVQNPGNIPEAISAYKRTDTQSCLPERDKTNYIEFTRISGILEKDVTFSVSPPNPNFITVNVV